MKHEANTVYDEAENASINIKENQILKMYEIPQIKKKNLHNVINDDSGK